MHTRLLMLVFACCALSQLTACGQKGDLYLPEPTPPPVTDTQS